jgi:hypothetical protein
MCRRAEAGTQAYYEAGPSWLVEFAGSMLAVALNLCFPYLVSIRAVVATVFFLAANNALAERVRAFPLALSIHCFPFSLCLIRQLKRPARHRPLVPAGQNCSVGLRLPRRHINAASGLGGGWTLL